MGAVPGTVPRLEAGDGSGARQPLAVNNEPGTEPA